MRLQILIWLFISYFTPVFSVKDYLFKNCDQSGFCNRNKHYANEISKLKNYESIYFVEPKSVRYFDSNNTIEGEIIKVINAEAKLEVVLPFQISLLQNNNLRFRIIEKARSEDRLFSNLNFKRYDEAAKYALIEQGEYEGEEKVIFQNDNNRILIKYGPKNEYLVEINLKKFQINLKVKGEVQLTINERDLLNFEHYRTQEENEKHLLPMESAFDMFQDSFKDAKLDKLPFGAESIALDVDFKGFKHVYGIPEHADSMSLKDTSNSNLPYRLFNIDIFEYETESKMPMYGSIPFMMAQKPGITIGFFWINSAETYIDIHKSSESTQTHWISENGIIDFVILVGSSPSEVSLNYGSLTGYTSLPQLFSIGHHQCRWNYNDENDVLQVSENMDKYQIPYDVIWLDIEYTNAKKYFTWSEDNFPNPDRMLSKLDRTGRKLVAIIDPHLKVGYEISDNVESGKFGINDANNETYHGHCWPGESVWIDTLNPTGVDFWKKQFLLGSNFIGQAKNLHLWNDMNEPSVFNGPETTSPKDNIHYGGWEHRSVHNLYGLTLHEATFNGLRERDGHRPFILTRSYFAGSQRTAAMWTGDNMSKWEYLKASIPMVLTSGISGMPFAGADVGGFFGNPSKELLTRWYQTGIWYPFFRAHAHIDSRRREPWIAGEPYTSIIRDAIKIRYSLLPTFYTSFYESSITGLPIMKPMFYETPDNEETYDMEDQFFIGNSGLLIKPVTEEGQITVSVYLPDKEIYYDYFTYDAIEGKGYHECKAPLEKIPVFLKGGNIIPKKERYRRSSRLMANDPYTLIIALNSKGEASGTLYIDDGETYGYENNDFVLCTFDFQGNILSSTISNSNLDLDFTKSLDSVTIEKVVLVGYEGANKVKVTQSGASWNAQISKGDRGEYVVKKPDVIINRPWTISLSDEKLHDEL